MHTAGDNFMEQHTTHNNSDYGFFSLQNLVYDKKGNTTCLLEDTQFLNNENETT